MPLFRWASRSQLDDRDAVPGGQPLRDEGAMAGLGIALDAEEGGPGGGRQFGDECTEVDAIEDFSCVARASSRTHRSWRRCAARDDPR
jgi:hypothetical protein